MPDMIEYMNGRQWSCVLKKKSSDCLYPNSVAFSIFSPQQYHELSRQQLIPQMI